MSGLKWGRRRFCGTIILRNKRSHEEWLKARNASATPRQKGPNPRDQGALVVRGNEAEGTRALRDRNALGSRVSGQHGGREG